MLQLFWAGSRSGTLKMQTRIRNTVNRSGSTTLVLPHFQTFFFLLVKFNKILGTLPVVTLKKEAVPVLVPYAVVPVDTVINFCRSSFVCSPTRETIADYRESFGDDFFCFWVRGVCFLVLNSQFYEDPSNVLELYEGIYQYPDFSAISSVEEPIVLRIRIRLRSGSLIKN